MKTIEMRKDIEMNEYYDLVENLEIFKWFSSKLFPIQI